MISDIKDVNKFIETDIHSLEKNVFKLLDKEWMLITAGSNENFNTMTASWGGLGVLWHKNVCFIFVRPTRYTYEFTEGSEFFTLSFFTEEYRDALNYCGKYSGRDVDKIKECGFNPLQFDKDVISFEEAKLIITCRKIYHHDINPLNFIDPGIDKNYPKKDYHRMYIGEIIKAYSKK
jgi:flavin reductase (DIM6/NTAB) family NADH-FMN oxidoreductase RutF